jgi:hypothetical protein
MATQWHVILTDSRNSTKLLRNQSERLFRVVSPDGELGEIRLTLAEGIADYDKIRYNVKRESTRDANKWYTDICREQAVNPMTVTQWFMLPRPQGSELD